MRLGDVASLINNPSLLLAALTLERAHGVGLASVTVDFVCRRFDQLDEQLCSDPTLKAALLHERQTQGGYVRALQGVAARMNCTDALEWMQHQKLRVPLRQLTQDPASMHPLCVAIEEESQGLLDWFVQSDGPGILSQRLPGNETALSRALSQKRTGLVLWMIEQAPELAVKLLDAPGKQEPRLLTVDRYARDVGKWDENQLDALRAACARAVARQALNADIAGMAPAAAAGARRQR